MERAFDAGSENSSTFSTEVEEGDVRYLWVPYAFVGYMSVRFGSIGESRQLTMISGRSQ